MTSTSSIQRVFLKRQHVRGRVRLPHAVEGRAGVAGLQAVELRQAMLECEAAHYLALSGHHPD